MKKRTTIAGAVALLSLAGFPASAGARDACDGPPDHDTFSVEMTPVAKTVERGKAAQIRATVYRSVDGRELAPAEGARVVVSLRAGDFVRAGGALTDDNGRATIRIRLDKRFPTGWADAGAFATREPADLPCHPYRETGGVTVERFVRIS